MKTYLFAAVSAALIAGCTSQAQTEPATPGITTKAYNVSGFTALDVATGIEVEFETGSAHSVIVENENGAWDKIEVVVDGDTLSLRKPYNSGMGYKKNKEKFFVTVSAPSLYSLETSSGSRVTGSGLSGDEVYVDTSSGSSVTVADIDAGSIVIETSSGSSVTLSGTCASASTDTSSGSSLRAKDLVCSSAEMESSSGSSTSITAQQSVDAKASSGSSISVSGNPSDRNVKKSSGGSVTIRS